MLWLTRTAALLAVSALAETMAQPRPPRWCHIRKRFLGPCSDPYHWMEAGGPKPEAFRANQGCLKESTSCVEIGH